MATKFNILGKIQTVQSAMLESADLFVSQLAEMEVLGESVLQLLANISTKASAGQTIDAASAESLAAFMAGVEALANQLPKVENDKTKRSILSLMSNIGVNQDGTATTNIDGVASFGHRYPDLYKKYIRAFKIYELSLQRNRPAGQPLERAAKRLQQQVDQAIRVSTSRRPEPALPRTPVEVA